MIGWLRFIGLINAAAWFGTAVFFTFAAGPLASSEALKELLATRNQAYFSEAIGHLIAQRYLQVSLVCGSIALLHFLAEWLYFGRSPRKFWLLLVVSLVGLGVIEAWWIGPRLKQLNVVAHATNLTEAQKQPAAASLRAWRGVVKGCDVLVLCALGLYLWRVANPPETTRFVSTSKFRS